MFLELVKEENLFEYANIVLKLCKEHFKLREKIGYEDYEQEKQNFNVYNIIGEFKKTGVNYYFIKSDNIIVGTIASYERNSEINNEPIIYVDSFYILPEYRKMGFGKKTIEEMKKNSHRKKLNYIVYMEMKQNYFMIKLVVKKLKLCIPLIKTNYNLQLKLFVN